MAAPWTSTGLLTSNKAAETSHDSEYVLCGKMTSSSPTETATTYTIPSVKLSTVLSKKSSENFTLAAEDIEAVYVGVSIGNETKLSYNGKSITGTSSGSIAITKTHQSQSVTLSLRFNYVGYIERYYGDWGFSDSYSNTGLAVYGSYTITVPAKTHYTVTYNANSGSGAPSAQTKWHGETLALSSTKPTRSGYVFWHWNTKADNTGTTYAAGANYTANSAATLYAIWNPIISYNANGGTGAPASQTKTYGTDLTLSSTKPTRTNLTFGGWGTSSTATTVAYAAGAKYTSNSAATLYAIWKYTVNFNGNGNGVNPAAQTAVYGHNVTIAGYPTRSGYRFLGWNTKADGTGTHYAPGASVAVNENCTLYAQWRKVTVSSVKVTRNGTSAGFTSTWSCSSTVGGTVAVTAQYSLDDGDSWHDCTLTGDATKTKVAGTDLSGTVSWSSTVAEDKTVRVMVTASFTDTYSSTSISGGHVETAQRGGTIPKEFRLFDALHGGTGLAIGTIATLANTFEVALTTLFQNVVEVAQGNITRDGTYTEPMNGDHQIRLVDSSRRILSYLSAHKAANSSNNYLRLTAYGPSGSKTANVYISASDTNGFISTDCVWVSGIVSDTSAHVIKDTRFDRDGANPSSDVWSSVFCFRDKDDEHLGYLQAYQLTNGATGLSLQVYAEGTDGTQYGNYIRLSVDKNGGKAYAVGDAAKFRSAIGAVSTDTYETVTSDSTGTGVVTAKSNFSVYTAGNLNRAYKRNGVATVYLGFKTTNALTADTSYNIGTLKSGWRPNAMAGLWASGTRYGINANTQANGEIYMTPTVAIPAGTTFYLSGTFVQP